MFLYTAMLSVFDPRDEYRKFDVKNYFLERNSRSTQRKGTEMG